MLAGRKSAIASLRTVLRIARQHDRGLDRAAMDAVAQFFCREQSIRCAEARPARGDDEKPVMRAQILRDQRHRRAVAAMARHHDELLRSPARATLSPSAIHFLQRDVGRQRQRAGIVDMLGGNADGCIGRKVTGKRGGQQFAHPCQIGLADQDVGFERQMRAVLLGRRQRQHRDPARGVACWRYRASGCRSSRGAERLKSSSEAFLWMNLQR